jgi:hypothetical protein
MIGCNIGSIIMVEDAFGDRCVSLNLSASSGD